MQMLAPAPVAILVGRSWTGPDGAIWIQQQGAAASASRLLRYDPIANTWLLFGLGLITTSACICPVGSWIYYVGQTGGSIEARRLPSTVSPIITALPPYITAFNLPASLAIRTGNLVSVTNGTIGNPVTLRPFKAMGDKK